jgi:hypothetical protein
MVLFMQPRPKSCEQASGPEARGEKSVRRARERLERAVATLKDAAESADARYRKMLFERNAARAEAERLRESQKALAERLGSAIERLRGVLGE